MRYFVYVEYGEDGSYGFPTDDYNAACMAFELATKNSAQPFYYATMWDNVNGIENCDTIAHSQGTLE